MIYGIRIFARIVSLLVRILPLFISTLLLMSTLYGTSITHYLTMGNGHVRQLLSPYKLGLSFTNQESRLQNRTFIYKWGVLGYKWDSQFTIYLLIIWMSIKGVLFNGTQHFPLWCWLFALCYSSLNTIIVFVESFQIDTVFYLEQINQRIIVSLIFLTVYFLGVLLFFYISYRIAIRKIKKLSTDI